MSKNMSDLRIIVLEDEFLVGHALARSLQEASAKKVVVTESIAEANKTLSGELFDVAILDIRLGDGESWELAEELEAKGTPLVIHSGNLDTVEQARLPGAIMVEKPATKEQLVTAVLNAHKATDPFFDRPPKTIH